MYMHIMYRDLGRVKLTGGETAVSRCERSSDCVVFVSIVYVEKVANKEVMKEPNGKRASS